MKNRHYIEIAALVLGLFALCIVHAADELSVSQGWTYNKNNRRRVLASTTIQYDVAGNAVIENVQAIGTNAAGEALVLGDVSDPGFAWFHNTSSNDYLEVGTYDGTNFTAFLKLYAGQRQTCWLATSAPRAITYTNSVNLDYIIIDR